MTRIKERPIPVAAALAGLSLWLSFAVGCGSSGAVDVDAAPPDGSVDATGTDGATDAAGEAPTPDAEPLANVFVVSPLVDEGKTTEVTLAHLTEPQMTGKYANIFNCLNKDGGDEINVNLGGMTFTGKVCKIEKTVAPGPDGTYLHIAPSADNDPDDPFAELHMYHHVTTIHDLFKDRLGVTHMDHPMRAVVNIQAFVDLINAWLGLENAAFVPKETASFLAPFGVDINDGEDTLVFTQGDADPAYDATVIYHEYTHAVIGRALFGSTHDQYGLDPTPGALNEGLADYFSGSFLDTPVVGGYTLKSFSRDLRRTFRCPEHVVGEMHQDGEVVGGTLWALRELLSPDTANEVIANALSTFTLLTTFEEASAAFLDEVQTLAPDKLDQVQTLLEDRGLIGCNRLKVYEGPITPPAPPAASPRYAGRAEVASSLFAGGVPSFLQYRVTLADTTEEVVVRYKAQSLGFQGLLPGGPGDLSVALRRGSDPITWEYSSGTAVSTADTVLKGQDVQGNARRLVLSGSCIGPGDLVLQFINHGQEGGQLLEIEVTQSETVTGVPNYDDCTP